MPIRAVSDIQEPTQLKVSKMAARAASLLEPEDARDLLSQTDYHRIMPNGLTFEQDRIFRKSHGVEKEFPAPEKRAKHRFPLVLDLELVEQLDAIVAKRRFDERKYSASSRKKIIVEALEAYLPKIEPTANS